MIPAPSFPRTRESTGLLRQQKRFSLHHEGQLASGEPVDSRVRGNDGAWRRLVQLFIGALIALSNPCYAAPAATVSLIFTGDIMLDDGPGRAIAAGRDPFAQFDAILKQADHTIGNLECPVATTGAAIASKIYTFRAAPAALDTLKGRYQTLSVANNHSGDYGKEAFLETLQHVRERGFNIIGGGRNAREAHTPQMLDIKGIKIALLAYDEFKPRSFEAGPNTPGIAWSEDHLVRADIRAARKAGADLVIPFMHWGWEREPDPSARQRQLARLMIDAGADVVVGAHPHITQGAEYYKGKLIVYSLGNFVFDSFKSDALRTGWVLRLVLNRKGLEKWDTQGAFMDEEGIPQRMPHAQTPCGIRGDATLQTCANSTSIAP